MIKKSLCRPDDIHWCIECCYNFQNQLQFTCPLLGETGDGKKGCLGHNGKKTSEGLTKRYICQIFDCLTDFNQKEREKIRQIIIGLPPGQFGMSEILLKYKEEKDSGSRCPSRNSGR